MVLKKLSEQMEGRATIYSKPKSTIGESVQANLNGLKFKKLRKRYNMSPQGPNEHSKYPAYQQIKNNNFSVLKCFYTNATSINNKWG